MFLPLVFALFFLAVAVALGWLHARLYYAAERRTPAGGNVAMVWTVPRVFVLYCWEGASLLSLGGFALWSLFMALAGFGFFWFALIALALLICGLFSVFRDDDPWPQEYREAFQARENERAARVASGDVWTG